MRRRLPFCLTATTSLHAYQVVQRNASNEADLTVSGTILTAGAHDVEARWNGGAWTVIDDAATGTFSGTLAAQSAGQGTLEVRLADLPLNIEQILNVGIGDVFICAGQSNMSGRGTNNQAYSHATLKAALFGNNYAWKELSDPYDSATGQTDAVSSDSSPAAAGSFLPILATLIMADQNVPVAFVPCAKGGTSITDWLPGADHSDRTTLYGSMNYRISQTGVKAVLLWLGETDAIAGMDAATFNGHLDTVANAVGTDASVKVIPCKLQNSSGIADDPNEAAINTAIGTAWADNANVAAGPDLTDIASDDTYHLQTDAKLLTAAQRWFAALAVVFYP